ncbi:MAG TPA: hypothetical protein VF516_31850 [Kofleriaceae bacterium]
MRWPGVVQAANIIDEDIQVPPKAAAQVYHWARHVLDKLKRAITPAHLHVLELLDGHKVARCLCVAVQLGIADQLNDGPRACTDLARAIDVNADALASEARELRCRALRQLGRGDECAPASRP